MKKLVFSLALAVAPALWAFSPMTTMDPRMMQPQQVGYGPSMMQMGEWPTNNINGQVCPPQIAPMQAPLTPQGVMPLTNQFQQGVHGPQMFRMQ